MLSIARERLLERSLALRSVMELYGERDPGFTSAALDWLEGTEKSLGEIRHPLAGLAAAERGRVLAVADGLRDAEVSPQVKSPRRAERAGAAASLARVERELRAALAGAEQELARLRDLMAQLVAVASASHPVPLPATEPRESWLRTVWDQLGRNGDTQKNHAYLAARLPWVDRLYVLAEVLDNLLGGPG